MRINNVRFFMRKLNITPLIEDHNNAVSTVYGWQRTLDDKCKYITKFRNPGEVSTFQAFALSGNATLLKLDVYELNSIWR